MGPHLAGEAAAAGLELIDTTCPLVTKVQRLAQKLVRQGYFLVVYGDSYHPEVRSVIGWAGTSKAVAAKKIADLPWNAPRGASGEGVVDAAAQGGGRHPDDQERRRVDDVRAEAAGDGHAGRRRVPPLQHDLRADLRAAECAEATGRAGPGRPDPGHRRPQELQHRAAGRGRQAIGVPSYHIERTEDIEDAWLADADVVGVTAGASTPDDVIEAVVADLARRGYAPPEDGIRPIDPEYVPAY